MNMIKNRVFIQLIILPTFVIFYLFFQSNLHAEVHTPVELVMPEKVDPDNIKKIKESFDNIIEHKTSMQKVFNELKESQQKFDNDPIASNDAEHLKKMGSTLNNLISSITSINNSIITLSPGLQRYVVKLEKSIKSIKGHLKDNVDSSFSDALNQLESNKEGLIYLLNELKKIREALKIKREQLSNLSYIFGTKEKVELELTKMIPGQEPTELFITFKEAFTIYDEIKEMITTNLVKRRTKFAAEDFKMASEILN